MIFLSRLTLDPRSRQAAQEFRNPYEMHRTLSRAFGDGPDALEEARCLFRAEEPVGAKRAFVIVQSRVQPAWDRLPQTGYLESPPDVNSLDPRFPAGVRLAFRLRANPTVKREGRRHAVLGNDELKAWMERKAAAGGFSLLSVTARVEQTVQMLKPGLQPAPLHCVLFDGILQVDDPTLFHDTVEAGIGTARGMGFGLLSLARPPGI